MGRGGELVTAEQSRAIAAMMERLPPESRKMVQLEILRGADPRVALMKAMGR